MPRDEPAWWYGERQQAVARALEPAAAIYGAVAASQYRRTKPYRSNLAVMCVGNFTAGGTGKTPTAITIVERLKSLGETPVVLTRGYGGSLPGPVWVDANSHSAAEVGDEPLLLTKAARVMVARDRRAGAAAIEASGIPASVIVMDDGLQNPALFKDLSLAIVDAERGLGNSRVIPAGPLRAPLSFQLPLCNAIVMMQNSAGIASRAATAERVVQKFSGPVLNARLDVIGDTSWLPGNCVVAFAGIGNPQRFFAMLQTLGASLVESVTFRDHQMLTPADALDLLAKAKAARATLVTTEKDWVRLPASAGPLGDLKRQARVLPVQTVFESESSARLDEVLKSALARFRQRVSAV